MKTFRLQKLAVTIYKS